MKSRILIFITIFTILTAVETVIANVIGDINGDGQVGLQEALFALQVAAGQHPNLPETCVLTGAGVWDADGKEYIKCDTVSHADKFYVALVSNTSEAANAPDIDPITWSLLPIKFEGVQPNQFCPQSQIMWGINAQGQILCTRQFIGKIVFVTSEIYNGNLGGLSGADSICQGLADTVGLSGTFKAWLSDDTSYPEARFVHSTGAYILVNGTPIAESWTDLIDGDLINPISRDEHGTFVDSEVWTATLSDGGPGDVGDTIEYCDNWTSDNYNYKAITGLSTAKDSIWTAAILAGRQCDWGFRLYCIEQ